MEPQSTTPFVPTLTVSVASPLRRFLERLDRTGATIPYDATSLSDSLPVSKELWQKFEVWALGFERVSFGGANTEVADWDWVAFHLRGLELARLLKTEVGDSYRVIYRKTREDPNSRIDAQREVLPDGRLLPILAACDAFPEPPQFCQHIVSGGQTGADRAALDFAMMHGYTHGGWAPQGRNAEDGRVPLKYQLNELVDGGFRKRTRRNVQDSDGTLIVNLGDLDGGTLATQVFAERLSKPHLVVQLDAGVSEHVAARVLAWLREKSISTLNVAGPRQSKRPGIHDVTVRLLEAVHAAVGTVQTGKNPD